MDITELARDLFELDVQVAGRASQPLHDPTAGLHPGIHEPFHRALEHHRFIEAIRTGDCAVGPLIEADALPAFWKRVQGQPQLPAARSGCRADVQRHPTRAPIPASELPG